MKKYFSLYLLAVAASLSMVSCDKDTEGLTWITYYPEITLEGDIYDQCTAGTSYVDPGYTAELDGKDITSEVVVKTSMDLSNPQPGYYTVYYTVVNADGIEASATRNVLVTAAGDPVSGYYTTQRDSYRNYNGMVYYGGYREIIYGTGEGTYYVSDLLGGWYQYRAGYGQNYAMTGEISVDEGGKVELLDSYIVGWGDRLDFMENGTYDFATGTISYDIAYVGMPFKVIMSK